MTTPYRRSIWEDNVKYKTPSKRDGAVDFKLITKLQIIEAAKKRTPPIPIAQLSKLAKALKSRPKLNGLDAVRAVTIFDGLVFTIGDGGAA